MSLPPMPTSPTGESSQIPWLHLPGALTSDAPLQQSGRSSNALDEHLGRLPLDHPTHLRPARNHPPSSKVRSAQYKAAKLSAAYMPVAKSELRQTAVQIVRMRAAQRSPRGPAEVDLERLTGLDGVRDDDWDGVRAELRPTRPVSAGRLGSNNLYPAAASKAAARGDSPSLNARAVAGMYEIFVAQGLQPRVALHAARARAAGLPHYGGTRPARTVADEQRHQRLMKAPLRGMELAAKLHALNDVKPSGFQPDVKPSGFQPCLAPSFAPSHAPSAAGPAGGNGAAPATMPASAPGTAMNTVRLTPSRPTTADGRPTALRESQRSSLVGSPQVKDALVPFGYHTLGPIAAGAFTMVVRARHLESGCEYAVKSFMMRAKGGRAPPHVDSVKTELQCLERLQGGAHENVANLVEKHEGPYEIHAILQYCSGGTLHRYLQTRGHGNGMDEAAAAPLICQVRARDEG